MTDISSLTQPFRVYADRLFAGDCRESENMVVTYMDGVIIDVTSFDPAKPMLENSVHTPIAAPGFIDIQINGACDRQFNELPDVETVTAIANGARAGGTAYVLPTHTTAPGEDYVQAMRAVEAAVIAGVPGILGIHLEGPFLSTEKPGIHAVTNIRPIEQRDIKNIGSFTGGKILITLAPECQPKNSIQNLVSEGAIVFAGHSNATAKEIEQAISEGLAGVTHLFNAMSQMTGREPGIVGAALVSDQLYCGIIADGHHVAWSNVRLSAGVLRCHLCLVTDAMRTLEGEEAEFSVHGKKIRLQSGRLTDATGRLAGAQIAMDACVRNIINFAGVDAATAISMASTNPARALKLDDQLGYVAPGYRASLSLLTDGYRATSVLVDGHLFPYRKNA